MPSRPAHYLFWILALAPAAFAQSPQPAFPPASPPAPPSAAAPVTPPGRTPIVFADLSAEEQAVVRDIAGRLAKLPQNEDITARRTEAEALMNVVSALTAERPDFAGGWAMLGQLALELGSEQQGRSAASNLAALGPHEPKGAASQVTASLVAKGWGPAAKAPAAATADERLARRAMDKLARDIANMTQPEEVEASHRKMLELSKDLTKVFADDAKFWGLRGAAAIKLDQSRPGWEAGQALMRLNVLDSGDEALIDLVSDLKLRGWLEKEFAAVEARELKNREAKLQAESEAQAKKQEEARLQVERDKNRTDAEMDPGLRERIAAALAHWSNGLDKVKQGEVLKTIREIVLATGEEQLNRYPLGRRVLCLHLAKNDWRLAGMDLRWPTKWKPVRVTGCIDGFPWGGNLENERIEDGEIQLNWRKLNYALEDITCADSPSSAAQEMWREHVAQEKIAFEKWKAIQPPDVEKLILKLESLDVDKQFAADAKAMRCMLKYAQRTFPTTLP